MSVASVLHDYQYVIEEVSVTTYTCPLCEKKYHLSSPYFHNVLWSDLVVALCFSPLIKN